MSFVTNRVDMTETRAIIYDAGSGDTALAVRNIGEATVHIGGVAVTDQGFPLEAGEVVHLSMLGSGDPLHGICAAGETTTVSYLAKA